MKYIFMIMLLISQVSIAAPVFDAGAIKFTGDTYISTLGATETKGIGRVSTITQGDNILWSAGDSGNYINFVFGGFAPVLAPVAPFFNYAATGGYVNFYLNGAGVFNTAASLLDTTNNISSGSLLLSTVAKGPTVGISTGVTYSANGFLDVTDGLFSWLLNTNSRPTFESGVFSDLTFGLVGVANQSTNVNKDYQIIASSDLQGSTVAAVPVPGAVIMFLTGLITILGIAKRKQTL